MPHTHYLPSFCLTPVPQTRPCLHTAFTLRAWCTSLCLLFRCREREPARTSDAVVGTSSGYRWRTAGCRAFHPPPSMAWWLLRACRCPIRRSATTVRTVVCVATFSPTLRTRYASAFHNAPFFRQRFWVSVSVYLQQRCRTMARQTIFYQHLLTIVRFILPPATRTHTPTHYLPSDGRHAALRTCLAAWLTCFWWTLPFHHGAFISRRDAGGRAKRATAAPTADMKRRACLMGSGRHDAAQTTTQHGRDDYHRRVTRQDVRGTHDTAYATHLYVARARALFFAQPLFRRIRAPFDNPTCACDARFSVSSSRHGGVGLRRGSRYRLDVTHSSFFSHHRRATACHGMPPPFDAAPLALRQLGSYH